LFDGLHGAIDDIFISKQKEMGIQDIRRADSILLEEPLPSLMELLPRLLHSLPETFHFPGDLILGEDPGGGFDLSSID
jgi:hypothetical protein